MGAAQAIPIVGEVVTVAEGGGKAIAAGLCAAVGEDKAAEELIHGACQTFKDYSEVSAIGASINMAVAAANGDHEKVELLKERQSKAWVDVAENTPLVGHGIGAVRYATGDSEGGDRCMIGATRSTIVLAATVATGGAGALACGAAAAGSGMAYDGITTVYNSAAKQRYAPVGIVAGIEQAIETGNANDLFDAVSTPLADAAAGALHGRLKVKAIKGHAERSMPAAELIAQLQEAEAASSSSIPESTTNKAAYTENQGSSRKVSFAELKGNRRTASFVKEFQNPAEAMRRLERGQKYDFVRMQDGKMRAIKQSDAAKAGQILGESVGHTSLVEPGTSIVAAGEVHIGPTGIIENINCQSGHFRIPLSSMRNQMGRVLPCSVLTFESPTFTSLLSRMAENSPISCTATHIGIYTPNLIAVLPDVRPSISTPLSSTEFILAFYECTSVRIIASPGVDETCAKEAYDAVPLTIAKVLISKPGDTVLATHGETQYADMCREEVRLINSVFPLGSWRQTSREVETWFDSTSGRFQMRCACRARDGKWRPNAVQFKPEDRMANQNGKLVKLL